MSRQLILITICIVLTVATSTCMVNHANQTLSWIPNTTQEFTNKTFNAWFTKADCLSLKGKPGVKDECQGAHYPNEICCQELTQAKLEGLEQESLKAAPQRQTQQADALTSEDQDKLNELLKAIDTLNSRITQFAIPSAPQT